MLQAPGGRNVCLTGMTARWKESFHQPMIPVWSHIAPIQGAFFVMYAWGLRTCCPYRGSAAEDFLMTHTLPLPGLSG